MSHEYELDTDERMMREGERYEKEKMKEFLINEHGMDIVEESNCLPKQMMYKSMASKLAEYKVKFFIGMFDDEDWDYDRPDTLNRILLYGIILFEVSKQIYDNAKG